MEVRAVRVVHLPLIIANNAPVISKYLRRLGVDSTVVSYFRTWLGYEGDVNLDLDRLDAKDRQQRLHGFVDEFMKREAPRYDVFHFHFCESLATGGSFGGWQSHPGREPYWDLAALKAMGKKVVVSSFGSDVRNNSKLVYWQLKYDDPTLELPRPPLCTRPQYFKIWQFAQHADAIVSGDTELCAHVPWSTTIPIPIDLEPLSALKAAPQPEAQVFSILHAPSNNLLKGSRYIMRACERLKRTYGERIELRYIHGVAAQDALKMYPGRGVAIDQVNMTLGLFALEAMYLGRPVVCTLRAEEFLATETKLRAPVVRVGSEEEMCAAVAEFIEGRAEADLKALEDYVVEHHSAEVVARQYKALYERLLAGEALPSHPGQRWMRQFDRLIRGQKVDRDGYYPKVTDLLLARRDWEALAHEVQNGLGLSNDADLLAKLVLSHAAAGRGGMAEQLEKQNAKAVATPEYRQAYARARGVLDAGARA